MLGEAYGSLTEGRKTQENVDDLQIEAQSMASTP